MPPDESIRKEAEERSAPAPTVVFEAIRLEGEDELERKTSSLVFSALAAGLSMGFSLISEGLLQAHLPDAEWRPLVSKLGYSVGFLVVVLARQQLFTENPLTSMLPLLARPTPRNFLQMSRLWSVVLAMNLAGAALIAYVIAHAGIFDAKTLSSFVAISAEGLDAPFFTVVVRGVFAGWLIALMVYCLPAAETARVGVIVLITYLIAIGGFAHVIAGSVDKLMLVAMGRLSLGGFAIRFLLPALVGNILGGVSLVAALNYGAAGRDAQRA